MNVPVEQSINLFPLIIYIIGILVVMAAMYGLPALLGQRHEGKETNFPFESGIKPTGSARSPISVKFYLVAMLFVIFDLEAAFIFTWAVAARELGWSGYWGMIIFMLILVAGLIFEWRIGALDWLPHKGRFIQRSENSTVGRTEQTIEQ